MERQKGKERGRKVKIEKLMLTKENQGQSLLFLHILFLSHFLCLDDQCDTIWREILDVM